MPHRIILVGLALALAGCGRETETSTSRVVAPTPGREPGDAHPRREVRKIEMH